MKTSSLLVVAGLVSFSTLLIKASTAEVTPPASIGQTSAGTGSSAHDCGGEPCDAVARGFRAFFDRQLDGLGANGRACADCHMPTDNFQLSPASVEARFQFLQWRRRWDPTADDPLFRPIDADDFRINGDEPVTSAISARTASSGSRFRCRLTSGSSIRRPMSRRRRRRWTSGGPCPQ